MLRLMCFLYNWTECLCMKKPTCSKPGYALNATNFSYGYSDEIYMAFFTLYLHVFLHEILRVYLLLMLSFVSSPQTHLLIARHLLKNNKPGVMSANCLYPLSVCHQYHL